jgi:hypothetical protein
MVEAASGDGRTGLVLFESESYARTMAKGSGTATPPWARTGPARRRMLVVVLEGDVYEEGTDSREAGARATKGRYNVAVGRSSAHRVVCAMCCAWRSLEGRVDECFAKRDGDERGQRVAQ